MIQILKNPDDTNPEKPRWYKFWKIQMIQILKNPDDTNSEKSQKIQLANNIIQTDIREKNFNKTKEMTIKTYVLLSNSQPITYAYPTENKH